MASTLNASTSSGLISSGDTSGVLALQTNNGTTAVTIDTSQNVGIGVTPASWASTYRALQIRNLGIMTINDSNWLYSNTYYNGTNNVYTSTGYAGAFDFNGVVTGGYSWRVAASGTAGNTISYTQAMVIDNSGNVGIGTTSPGNPLHIYSNTVSQLRIQAVSGNTNANINLAPSGTGVAILGTLSGAFPLTFQTNSSEAMRIDSSGNLLVGTTSSSFGEKLSVQSTASGTNIAYLNYTYTDDRSNTVVQHSRATGATSATMILFRNASSSQVGLISSTGSATTYGTSSDYRLKENIAPMTGALTKITQLKPCTYTWKDGGEQAEGFIAHELQEVVPCAVVGNKDAVNEDGSIKPQSIDTSFLVATLTAAIQEQQALITAQAETINALTARIVALEAK